MAGIAQSMIPDDLAAAVPELADVEGRRVGNHRRPGVNLATSVSQLKLGSGGEIHGYGI
jgi:hypothetical protein